jgi:FMN phosphatase YigB (HAD superfamily)
VTIQDTGIFDKKIVSFDFHGTLVERQYHHKPFRVEEATHINRPILEIFKRCLKLGIKTYIISAESISGNGEEGISNNERILKNAGVDFPRENIFCTNFAAKDTWFEDLNIQFHIDDEIGNILLARQMGIRGLLVDYKDHPISTMFTRIKLNGKVLNGEL